MRDRDERVLGKKTNRQSVYMREGEISERKREKQVIRDGERRENKEREKGVAV